MEIVCIDGMHASQKAFCMLFQARTRSVSEANDELVPPKNADTLTWLAFGAFGKYEYIGSLRNQSGEICKYPKGQPSDHG